MGVFGSDEKKQLRAEIETVKQENEKLKQNEEENKQKIKAIEESSNDLRQSVHKLEVENENLKNQLDTEEPYEKIYNERKSLLEENSEKSIQIKNLESENQKLIEASDEEKVRAERDKEKIKELETGAEKHTEKIKEFETEREELENQKDDLQKKNDEFEDEFIKMREEFAKIKDEKENMGQLLQEEKENEMKRNRQYIEDLRHELSESRNKLEGMMLESEALKSENESLFRANEAKKDEINEIQKEVANIKKELQHEQLRYKKIKQEWDEEKNRTEFVLVSKSARRRHQRGPESSVKEENDSEDEHVVGVLEAAKLEKESMIAKENELKKRVSQLQIDKDELFRSGTSLFAENKTLKSKYDQIVGERTMLLQVEAALKRKVKEQEGEIKDLKKTIDDLYYQNMAIRTNEENENKKSSYVVLMGNEMIKKLEREKSALHRRVKFLEKENNEIEMRVVELERQSADLVNYSKKYDKYTSFQESSRSRDSSYIEKPRSRGRDTRDTARAHYHSNRETPISRDRGRDRVRENTTDRNSHRLSDRDKGGNRNIDQRPPSGKMVYHEYRERPRYGAAVPTKSPDYYRSNMPPFANAPTRQTSMVPSVHSGQSHDSRFSFPPLGSRIPHSPRH